jgi:hypothetical protein
VYLTLRPGETALLKGGGGALLRGAINMGKMYNNNNNNNYNQKLRASNLFYEIQN